MVYRVYAEKKAPFAIEAKALLEELRQLPAVTGLQGLRILHRYDVEGVDEALFRQAIPTVFSEPPVDDVYYSLPAADAVLAVEYLPGQFDQRADSAAECIQLISLGERPTVRSASIYLLQGSLDEVQLAAIRDYVINPVEAREAALEERATLQESYPEPPDIPVLTGFLAMGAEALPAFITQYGLAMDEADLAFCQAYFREVGREPTLTELRLIDTYWSDHCRHTTFGTVLEHVAIEDAATRASYNKYLALREQLYAGRKDKPQTLMDIATIGAKAIKADGGLQALDESDEVNACSVHITADIDGRDEDWLLLFKNETHNHPTEIEPFGGAATCIGGAIRDPLANRGYVFGAMRVTGAGDPRVPITETLPGKLPQRKLTLGAAAGYSSYGNQIGLATGQVTELYHPGYIAKRMEIGAVLGAAPLANVVRQVPAPGDVVLLIGGRTGRDGCGGATGSSKAHGADSLASCGAEVQKGNPPMERKLQRLFRNPEATRLIRRCNDFGAGGVSVAIGELADGLDINLDAVPKKYDGLDGTELAISESQERMAVVIAPADVARFIALAQAENLEATRVATVTAEPRLVMRWRGDTIVDIARSFLNSNGAEKHADVYVPVLAKPAETALHNANTEQGAAAPQGFAARLRAMATSLNGGSQKGLVERFDSNIGAATVRMPFGGRQQLSPSQTMVMKLPVDGETSTCAGMAFGFDPYVSAQNPYTGAYLAVVESVAKLAAAGFALADMHLTFQEYFERLRDDAGRWGKPFSALLGALQAQLDLGVAAIGGKDSMSGSFEQLDVPPTLVSFAVAHGKAADVPCGEFQVPGSSVVWLRPATADGLVPGAPSFKLVLRQLAQLIREKKVLSVRATGAGGVAKALFEMGLGNRVGIRLADGIDPHSLFETVWGGFVVELDEPAAIGEQLGETIGRYELQTAAETIDLAGLQEDWEAVLEAVFPYRSPSPVGEAPIVAYDMEGKRRAAPKIGMAKPKALIPVFPGTNTEYDTARALRRAGADADVFVICNQTPAQVEESAAELARRIGQSQILMLPGGFSGGDEPEGSAKLITAFFRGPQVAAQVMELLQKRDGLILGICNGFQALVKLGLLPYGEIRQLEENSPTLTFNAIGRHQSMLVRTRVASTLSPWLSREQAGAIHSIAVSHGEGQFVADAALLQSMQAAGQIATQYVDLAGAPTMDVRFNPNGSVWAIEGITSADGRIYGKMGHTERSGDHVYSNVPGNKYQLLFEGGVDYFKI